MNTQERIEAKAREIYNIYYQGNSYRNKKLEGMTHNSCMRVAKHVIECEIQAVIEAHKEYEFDGINHSIDYLYARTRINDLTLQLNEVRKGAK